MATCLLKLLWPGGHRKPICFIVTHKVGGKIGWSKPESLINCYTKKDWEKMKP